MTLVTLVHGGSGDAREAAIAAHAAQLTIDANKPGAAIIEGLAGGSATLQDLQASAVMKVIRIAAGCPCCTGNLTMRITLNRVLRDKPAVLFLSIANASHRAGVRKFLQDPQYSQHLALGPELDCS